MSGCDATIRVGGGQPVPCNDHNPFGDGPSTHQHIGEFVLSWTDDSFGAKPHTPPRYEAHELTNQFEVWFTQGENDGPWLVAYFNRMFHPNPEGAAEAEAARLNGEDIDYRSAWLKANDKAMGLVNAVDVARRERDEARAVLDDLTDERDALERVQQQLSDELESALASASDGRRFRAALEKIAAVVDSAPFEPGRKSREIAREALGVGR